MPKTPNPQNPKPPIAFESHLKPPVTKRLPDEQNAPVTMHFIGLSFGPLPFRDVQRLAHAAHYGIVCDVTMKLPTTYDEPLEFQAILQGPKQGAWEEIDGEMRPRQTLLLVAEDFTLTADNLDDIATAAFPKKAPPAAVTILPRQEQLSMDDATNAVGDAIKGFKATVDELGERGVAVSINGHAVNTVTGEIIEEAELEEVGA